MKILLKVIKKSIEDAPYPAGDPVRLAGFTARALPALLAQAGAAVGALTFAVAGAVGIAKDLSGAASYAFERPQRCTRGRDSSPARRHCNRRLQGR